MNCRPFIACIAALAAIFTPGLLTAASALPYTFTTIDVPGSIATEPSGINDRGQITGVYFTSDGSTHGFLDARGTFTTIDVPGTASEGG
jgi:hypothetical protein